MTITAVILNWMQSRMTLGAIRNLRRFYPDMPLIVVDNGTPDGDMEVWGKVYSFNDKEHLYDKDLDKLRNAQKEYNFKLIELPENIGQGSAIDTAIDEIKTDFMLLFDNDARLVDGTLVDEFMGKMENDVFAVGVGYPDNDLHQSWVGLQMGLFRLAPIRKYHLTFGNVVFPYYDKALYLEPGCLVHNCLVSNYPDRTRKIKWRAVIYPRIDELEDRVVHLKILGRIGGELERWNKWIDG